MGTWYSPFNLNKVFSDKLESYGYKKIKNNNLVKSDTLIFYTTPDRIIIDLDFDIADDDISNLILKGYEEVKRFNNKYIFSEFHFSQLDLNQLDDYFKNGVSFFKKSITNNLNKGIALICKELLFKTPEILGIYKDLELVNNLIINEPDLNYIERVRKSININETVKYLVNLKINYYELETKFYNEINNLNKKNSSLNETISDKEDINQKQKKHFENQIADLVSSSKKDFDDFYNISNSKIEELKNKLSLKTEKESELDKEVAELKNSLCIKSNKEKELDLEIDLLKNNNKDLKNKLDAKDRDYKSAVDLIKIQDQLSSKSAHLIKRSLKNKYL